MPKRLAVLLSTVCIVAAVASSGTAGEPLSVLEYLGARAGKMAAELPAVPDTQQDWQQRRGQVLEDLSEVLSLPKREPMKAALMYRKEEGDLIIEQVMLPLGPAGLRFRQRNPR